MVFYPGGRCQTLHKRPSLAANLQALRLQTVDMSGKRYDAVVVGSGPNGLSAGIVLARRGLSVCVLEAKETIGGGARTAKLTAPGFWSDVCSAIHPVGVVSPFFKTLPLEQWGVEWVYPEV